MSCGGCLDLFSATPEDVYRATKIDAAAPDCGCENQQVSAYSDTPVVASETLVRLVLDPTHIKYENGVARLKTSFFSDASSFGASCFRKERASPDEYIRTVKMILGRSPKASDGTPRKVYGVVLVPASEVKRIYHAVELSGRQIQRLQAFCVYTTGDEQRPNHSDIMVNALSTITRSKAVRAERNLTEAVQACLLTAGEFRHVVDLTQWA
jgi:hypothetical protein